MYYMKARCPLYLHITLTSALKPFCYYFLGWLLAFRCILWKTINYMFYFWVVVFVESVHQLVFGPFSAFCLRSDLTKLRFLALVLDTAAENVPLLRLDRNVVLFSWYEKGKGWVISWLRWRISLKHYSWSDLRHTSVDSLLQTNSEHQKDFLFFVSGPSD